MESQTLHHISCKSTRNQLEISASGLLPWGSDQKKILYCFQRQGRKAGSNYQRPKVFPKHSLINIKNSDKQSKKRRQNERSTEVGTKNMIGSNAITSYKINNVAIPPQIIPNLGHFTTPPENLHTEALAPQHCQHKYQGQGFLDTSPPRNTSDPHMNTVINYIHNRYTIK